MNDSSLFKFKYSRYPSSRIEKSIIRNISSACEISKLEHKGFVTEEIYLGFLSNNAIRVVSIEIMELIIINNDWKPKFVQTLSKEIIEERICDLSFIKRHIQEGREEPLTDLLEKYNNYIVKSKNKLIWIDNAIFDMVKKYQQKDEWQENYLNIGCCDLILKLFGYSGTDYFFCKKQQEIFLEKSSEYVLDFIKSGKNLFYI